MEKEISLYIHIPFCRNKCLYCDFSSFSGKENFMLDYTKALCEEIASHNNKIISTIFIGGGTPTYLSLDCWNLLGNSIKKLRVTDNLEFTVEGNPDSFSIEKLKLFREIGVNRLSIGLQAWQNKLLKGLGRIHNIEQFKTAFKNAREAGFNNINVDLMFGLPGQSLEDWKETLQSVVELKPEHISSYSLIVEEGTPFYAMQEANRLRLPEEDIERQMFEEAVSYLNSMNYLRYEISNFSKPGFECRHNLTYWNLKDYIGCGSAAHSYYGGFRYRNTEDIEKYICMLSDKGNAVEEQHENALEEDMEEFMFMGLRKTEGIKEADFKEKFNRDIDEAYGAVIKKFLEKGLLIRREGAVKLSTNGLELSNQVMCEFLLS